MEYTKKELRIEKRYGLYSIYLDDKCICRMAFKEYAERLVLCWNEHDALEQELADYKEGCEGLKLSVQDFREQRDALLAACEWARDLYDQLALSPLEAAAKYGPNYTPPSDKDWLNMRTKLEAAIALARPK